MRTNKTEYDIQAEEFCTKHNVTIAKVYTGHRKYFPDDKTPRSTWEITITTPKGSHSFDFGQPILKSYEGRDLDKRTGWKRMPQSFPYEKFTMPTAGVQVVNWRNFSSSPSNLWEIKQAIIPPLTILYWLVCILPLVPFGNGAASTDTTPTASATGRRILSVKNWRMAWSGYLPPNNWKSCKRFNKGE